MIGEITGISVIASRPDIVKYWDCDLITVKWYGLRLESIY